MAKYFSAVNIANQASKIFEGLLMRGKASALKKNVPLLKNTVIVKINGQQVVPKFDTPQKSFWTENFFGKWKFSNNFIFRNSLNRLINSNEKFIFVNPLGKQSKVIPFYALVGLLGYNGMPQEEESHSKDYGKHVSSDIKSIAERFLANQRQLDEETVNELSDDTLEDYKLLDYVAQGSNAAVYQGKRSTEGNVNEELKVNDDVKSICSSLSAQLPSTESVNSMDGFDMLSDISDDFEVIGKEEDNDGDMEMPADFLQNWNPMNDLLHQGNKYENDSDLGMALDPSVDVTLDPDVDLELTLDPGGDLAIKMMFNLYSSNDGEIYERMKNELLPMSTGEKGSENRFDSVTFPLHYNIIKIKGWFIGDVPEVEFQNLFPAMMPPRINPNGFGKNRTMFIVMDRFESSLNDISSYNLSIKDSLMVFTQLIEACIHMTNHGIAHRDLKADNILLQLEEGNSCPHAVVCDFGLAYASSDPGNLTMPYPHSHVCKGGNSTLWPPEISLTKAGPRVTLDYSRSDLWALGVLAYEVFGAQNPFYSYNKEDTPLSSATYQQSQLPSLPDFVPYLVKSLINRILERNPRKRPSPTLVGNCLHLLLWLPASTLNNLSQKGHAPAKHVIMRWALLLLSKVILNQSQTSVEKQLQLNFLRRFDLNQVMEAFNYLQDL